jgi:hypothetical protein
VHFSSAAAIFLENEFKENAKCKARRKNLRTTFFLFPKQFEPTLVLYTN